MKRAKPTIKILLISPYFAPHIGGSQRYMEELYVHLSEQFPHISVDVLTYNTTDSKTIEKYRGITIYRVPCWEILPGQFALPNPIKLIALLYKLSIHRYSFVHTHLRFFDSTWWAWAYAKAIGAKSIFTEHVANKPVHQNPTVESIASVIDQVMATFALPKYDIVTVTNKSTQAYLNRVYHLRQRIHLIYGGVDTSYFLPHKQTGRVLPGIKKRIKPTDTIVSFVGRLIWAKGATKLYKTFRRLIPKLKRNVYLVIAGTGPQSTAIKKFIQQDNLEERVLFLGALNTKYVRQTLQATDIFVHPSHHNEGFPNVILEAGATGSYVIATDVAGVKEVIIPNKTGALLPAEDDAALSRALLWAITHAKKRKKIGKYIRTYLKTHFDWRLIVTEYHRLLVRSLQQSGHQNRK